MEQKKLNAVYSSREMKRPYEFWFLRCGMRDGSGAWWSRYLVMHLGRGSWGAPTAQPAQVWATWFPPDGEPCSFIHGFPIETLGLSERRTLPFYCRIANNGIEEGVCRGNPRFEGHEISWELRWNSDFGVTLSDKGWIGFSRSPHSDAAFSGETTLDGKSLQVNLWDLACRGTTAAIGTVQNARKCERTSPGRSRWRTPAPLERD
jgi:hypothetical protein